MNHLLVMVFGLTQALLGELASKPLFLIFVPLKQERDLVGRHLKNQPITLVRQKIDAVASHEITDPKPFRKDRVGQRGYRPAAVVSCELRLRGQAGAHRFQYFADLSINFRGAPEAPGRARLGAQGFWVMAALCALALPLDLETEASPGGRKPPLSSARGAQALNSANGLNL